MCGERRLEKLCLDFLIMSQLNSLEQKFSTPYLKAKLVYNDIDDTICDDTTSRGEAESSSFTGVLASILYVRSQVQVVSL